MPINPRGLTPGLVQRIRDRINQELRPEEPDENAMIDPMLVGPGVDAHIIMYRIRAAAAQRVLLYMKYNGDWRHVEPYSFRRRQTTGGTPLFYGFCLLHNQIHSFYVQRIQDIQVTDRPFNPRWEIEI